MEPLDDHIPVPRRRREDNPQRRLRKGLYILPSLVTTANIAAGYYAILQVTPVHRRNGGILTMPR